MHAMVPCVQGPDEWDMSVSPCANSAMRSPGTDRPAVTFPYAALLVQAHCICGERSAGAMLWPQDGPPPRVRQPF